MRITLPSLNLGRYKFLLLAAMLLFPTFGIFSYAAAASTDSARDGRLITIHDRGEERVILTHAQTIRDALGDADITVVAEDQVEPGLDEELVATDYTVNIYRARPVIVVDGATRAKIMTAAQTSAAIARDANITLRDEDEAVLSANQNLVADGAGVVLTIDRATEFKLKLYGAEQVAYSHEDTVGKMLDQKNIVLGSKDTLSVDRKAPLTAGMTVEVWRDGVQTATAEEAIKFPVRQIQDVDKPIGYKKIQTPGTNGKKSVTYEITMKSGKEVGRKTIQSVVLEQPKEQVEVVGAKPGNGLTKSKGVNMFVDSKGVAHRETYYDLPMNVVMRNCGAGGVYTVRADGTKVDKDGYVLIAAHLGNYPRCSIVETSLGLGKVYDTGGFTSAHPHGYDLATDWSNNNGS